ncbi:MAG: ATPase [Cytophagaceae bacterium]|nr:ATPase [Cytophagaceae bacterium]
MLNPRFLKIIFRSAFILSFLGVLAFIVDFGFDQSEGIQHALNGYYLFILIMGIAVTLLRYFSRRKKLSTSVIVFDAISIFITVYIMGIHFFSLEAHQHLSMLYNDNWVKVAILLTFVREFAEQQINLKRTYFNPAQVFILSFLGIILFGTGMLMLPKATHTGIHFLDALFTSTSAVCVTGLVVVDTGSFFTPFGQSIILVLIQLGGLGILTFASYFSYFFKGGSTYENQVMLSDITNSQKIGEVYSTLKRILIITFSIEAIGAITIFFSIPKQAIADVGDRIVFSVFHSISAFCNAGFSTLSSSLYDVNFRFNYTFQILIIALFVLGGLGFPIVMNLIKYLKYKAFYITHKKKKLKQPWVLNLNSRIILITTISLTVVGTILFYIDEYNNTLAMHTGVGKWVHALFGAATPRTAGFNSVPLEQLHFSTVMLVIFLMWIGASPASTGGGIKTSTFAIATLNFLSLSMGKTRIEVYRREVADISIKRAFAIMSLSLVVIGLAVIAISITDSELSLLSIAFECFSAYSTVGLTLGITTGLSSLGKGVIIVVMFVGRVSMLSIMIAIFNKSKYTAYRYPSEEILIN